MPARTAEIRPSAVAVLSPVARETTAKKWVRRHHPGPEVSVLANNEFTQQLNLRTRLTKTLMTRVLRSEHHAERSSLRAHENPKLAHHAAPHAKRVEYTLQGLILNTTNPVEQDALANNPEIIGATMVFPRGHDFWHQVLTGQRKLEEDGKFNAKHGHDKAAGLVMAAQADEYAEGLREAYQGSNIPDEQIQKEAQTTMLLAQIISSPHGIPTEYVRIMGQREKKAYTIQRDDTTGAEVKVPLQYQTEADAKALFEAYKSGQIDPFSMNQAQMMAITTYEITHSVNGAFDADKMRAYTYGKEPLGLHPDMIARYGQTLTDMAKDQRPFEEILPEDIMQQRDLIEYMGKLALLADTFDQVSDPTGRVVRSLLTQVTFTGKNPRPVWPHGLTESDLDAMLDEAKHGNGDDTRGDGAKSPTYSLAKRLDYEIKRWYPFDEMLDPEIATLVGEITVMAQLEQFRIIEAWMDNDRGIWSEPLKIFYKERVAQYEGKLEKRDPHTVFDASWLTQEQQEIPEILRGLPHAGEFTEDDRLMLHRYRDKSLADTKEKYGISDDKMAELAELSEGRKPYNSPYIKPMYDIVFGRSDTDTLPIRGLELAHDHSH